MYSLWTPSINFLLNYTSKAIYIKVNFFVGIPILSGTRNVPGKGVIPAYRCSLVKLNLVFLLQITKKLTGMVMVIFTLGLSGR